MGAFVVMALEYKGFAEARETKAELESVKSACKTLGTWIERVEDFKARKARLENIAIVRHELSRASSHAWKPVLALPLEDIEGVEPLVLLSNEEGIRLRLRSSSGRPVAEIARKLEQSSELDRVEIRVLAAGPEGTSYQVEADSQRGPS